MQVINANWDNLVISFFIKQIQDKRTKLTVEQPKKIIIYYCSSTKMELSRALVKGKANQEAEEIYVIDSEIECI